MAYDGTVLAAVVHELRQTILQARVERVFQPEREEIHIIFRQPGQNYRLLLSAQADRARVHLTLENKPNPTQPPLFCMVLRKYLEGGKLTRIEQPNLERILHLYIESPNEIGEITQKVLICEIMGKHSNIILLDAQTGMILDGIKRYTHALSRYREVLPGRPYLSPPPQNKINPLEIRSENFQELIWEGNLSQPIAQIVFKKISGLSPVLAREIIHSAGLDPYMLLEECGEHELALLHKAFTQFQNILLNKEFQPSFILKNNEVEWTKNLPLTPGKAKVTISTFNNAKNNQICWQHNKEATEIDALLIQHWLNYPQSVNLVNFSIIPLYHLVDQNTQIYKFPNINELVDTYFQLRHRQIRWQEIKQHLNKTLQTNLERSYRKLSLREDSFYKVHEAERYRLFGELLMTYLYELKPGQKEVTVKNLYLPEEPLITIPLSPRLSPVENAQYYFKQYNKARRSLKIVEDQLKIVKEELAYLESVSQSLRLASSLEDLNEIRQELIEQGYLKSQTLTSNHQVKAKTKKKLELKNKPFSNSKNQPIEFMSFETSEGYEVLVGKNNKQNDYLTLKIARKNDIWLHVKDAPGSHVILRVNHLIKNENENHEGAKHFLPKLGVSTRAIQEAALLAAYFSKSQYSSSVPVDFTLRRYVRKPQGAKPGYVIYDHHQTIHVTPSQENLPTGRKAPESL